MVEKIPTLKLNQKACLYQILVMGQGELILNLLSSKSCKINLVSSLIIWKASSVTILLSRNSLVQGRENRPIKSALKLFPGGLPSQDGK